MIENWVILSFLYNKLNIKSSKTLTLLQIFLLTLSLSRQETNNIVKLVSLQEDFNSFLNSKE